MCSALGTINTLHTSAMHRTIDSGDSFQQYYPTVELNQENQETGVLQFCGIMLIFSPSFNQSSLRLLITPLTRTQSKNINMRNKIKNR